MALFLDYVRSLQSDLHDLGQSSELCVVSGNESCDLDSIVSALVYAHYIVSAARAGVSDTDSRGDVCPVTLPLLQCQRADFAARKDAMMLMEELGIEVSSLVFLDDVTEDKLSGVEKLSVVLVDHHSPSGMLGPFASQVTRIIDHHEVSSPSLADKDEVTAVLEMTGSCATLIAREILKDEGYIMEEVIARALVTVILLDTGNLLAEGRMTDVDSTAVEDLLKFLPPSFSKDEHFTKYVSVLVDMSALSVKQALGRDYKECKVGERYVVGFCSLMLTLSDFLSGPEAREDLAEFFSARHLDALVMFGVSIPAPNSGVVHKQIAVYQPDGAPSEFTESLVMMFEANEELRCERMEGVVAFEGVVLEQGNVELSRKHIIPILASFIASVETEAAGALVQGEEEASATTETSVSASEEPFPLEPTINIISNTTEQLTKPSSSGEDGGDGGCGEDIGGGEDGGGGGGVSSHQSELIPEYSQEEEAKDKRTYLFVSVGGEETTISMSLVEPYKKIIQHTGYIGENRQALVVISACHLPPRSLPNHNHVLHHTFFYLLSVLDKLIVDKYTIVYLHSGAPQRSMPSLAMLHKIYRMLDRRLRKQLTQLFIVHPTFWVKATLRLARPILSKKFWRKVHFIPTLGDLPAHVKLDEVYIAGIVLAADQRIVAQKPPSGRYKSIDTAERQGPTPDRASEGSEPQAAADESKNGVVEETA